MNKQEILSNLKSEKEYLDEINSLCYELGVALLAGTLIKGEAEELELKMFEKIAIVEFIRGCKNEQN